jgi:hypothetical protein
LSRQGLRATSSKPTLSSTLSNGRWVRPACKGPTWREQLHKPGISEVPRFGPRRGSGFKKMSRKLLSADARRERW